MTIRSGVPAKWIRIALLNFTVVALAGTLLRYKVSYSLPGITFSNLLHAHSHFAFSGWVSTCLFAMIMAYFLDTEQQQKKYTDDCFC